MNDECIFCKIGAGIIDVDPVYENTEFIAFRDISPQAPIHVLLIPRRHYDTIMDITETGVLGRALEAVQAAAMALNLQTEGFRAVINCRDNGGQTITHFHFHILGGRFMHWPPG